MPFTCVTTVAIFRYLLIALSGFYPRVGADGQKSTWTGRAGIAGRVVLNLRDDRDPDARRVLGIMEDGLPRHNHIRPDPRRLTGVQVAVPAREAAAGHLKPQPVPGAKQIAGRPQVDVVLGRLGGLSMDPEDPIREVDRAAVWIHVAQPGDEVGRRCARAGPQRDLHRSGDLDVAPKLGSCIDKDVGARFDKTLGNGTGW